MIPPENTNNRNSLQAARIGILCPGFGLVMRGVEVYVSELISHIRKLHPNWEFDIYTRAGSGISPEGARLIHVPAIDRHGFTARLYAAVGHRLGIFLRTRIDAECLSFTLAATPRLLRAKYDIVLNQAGPFAGRLLRVKRKVDGQPFIHVTAAGYGPLELMMARQQPDALVAIAPYIRKWIQERVPEARTVCLPNPVDCSLFRQLSSDEMSGFHLEGLDGPIVLFVGAMDPMKRPELLISAMERVPEASLVMIGDGILSEEVRRLGAARLGEHRFRLITKVSREEMPAYYNACRLFTLPSEEPYGLVFVEAMACNKPVLANNSPVQRWMFADAGRTCDCTNSESYAQSITEMLASDYGNKPVDRSRCFDWPEIARQYVDLFSSIIVDRRGNDGG